MKILRTSIGAAGVLALAAAVAFGAELSMRNTSDAANAAPASTKMVTPTMPTTPSVGDDTGTLSHGVRTFRLTAMQFEQHIATFPIQHAKVMGWKITGRPDSTASTPGPTLVSFAGEKVQLVVTNHLTVPTSVHPHGLHQPNADDGVSGIDFTPIEPGQTRTYPAFTPGHAGTFAYHTHTDTAMQEPAGLAGEFIVLPKHVAAKQNPQVDLAMTLQSFNPSNDGGLTVAEGAPAVSQPNGRGMWPFNTINGKTGDAEGAPITIRQGDLVQIRLYNASDMTHSMHLHGQDMTLVAVNGHAVPHQTVTTKAISPGEFFTLQFRANNPGNWVFHCSFPGHQANNSISGYDGAPVGMTRIFHYTSAPAVPAQYFGPPTK